MSEQAEIALVIPALDEEAVIADVVRSLRLAFPPEMSARIIVVDNGSSDATGRVAAEAGADVISEPNRGYGRACLAGVSAATGAEILVFLDGDGSDDPADLSAILAPIQIGEADLVVGVRASPESGSMTPQQVWGNRLAGGAIALVTGVRPRDLGPFRAIRRTQLLALDMEEMTYGWSTEMLLKGLRAGLRYQEVKVSYRARRGGVSKVGGNLRGSVRAGWSILSTVARYASWSPTTRSNKVPAR